MSRQNIFLPPSFCQPFRVLRWQGKRLGDTALSWRYEPDGNAGNSWEVLCPRVRCSRFSCWCRSGTEKLTMEDTEVKQPAQVRCYPSPGFCRTGGVVHETCSVSVSSVFSVVTYTERLGDTALSWRYEPDCNDSIWFSPLLKMLCPRGLLCAVGDSSFIKGKMTPVTRRGCRGSRSPIAITRCPKRSRRIVSLFAEGTTWGHSTISLRWSLAEKYRP